MKQRKLENSICRQIQDLHANFWHKREKEAQRLFAKLHTPSLLQGFVIELIFALPCVYMLQFLRYWLIFKFPYLAMKSGICRNVPKLHMYSRSTTGSRN